MSEVAKEAGVSQPTVSLVLNGVGGARVNTATRDRVMKAAVKLGYIPRPRKPLVFSSPPIVAFLLNNPPSTHAWPSALAAVQTAAKRQGCALVTMHLDHSGLLNGAESGLLLSQRMAGILLSSSGGACLQKVGRFSAPVALIDDIPSSASVAAF
nr:LacI family DNA-binding transcriptional regulator [Pseudorhizobium sp.]